MEIKFSCEFPVIVGNEFIGHMCKAKFLVVIFINSLTWKITLSLRHEIQKVTFQTLIAYITYILKDAKISLLKVAILKIYLKFTISNANVFKN